MSRPYLPGILAMAVIVVASNILVQHLLGQWLTWGALTYPFAFLVTDLMNRLYGPGPARRVVLTGFLVGILCSLIGSQIQGEFGPLVTLRVAIGSGTAFLAAQLMDIAVFDRLRQGRWWRAPLMSTLIGSSLDTLIFFSIAFSATFNGLESGNIPAWAQDSLPLLGIGPQAPLWASLALADWMVKLGLALIALIPFRIIVTRLSAQPAKIH
ncbi:queuosine precursor transporter [Tropicimonas sp. IMCC6043]|uniref:queuosine precursor transporter n=1 Tax=Tropicimonas sp. IMCC6043 TaxID=2510645 RepID=UPI00101CD215|nr:queuosine precursor transporter [Tropicimonas sp. IMCC6043]RYH10116.1 VUT family protein [Tropicimonas sp. IMCC6043]